MSPRLLYGITMQKIIVTFTNAQGQITRQVLTRSEGQALSLTVTPGVQVAVQVQTPTLAAGQAAAPKSLQARPRGREQACRARADDENVGGLHHYQRWCTSGRIAAS